MGAKSEAKAFLRLHGADWQRGLKQARRDMENFRSSVDNEMRKVAAAVAAVGAASTVLGTTYEYQMSKVKSVARATGAEMAQLEKAARSLGASTQFSAQQVAEAEENLLRAGMGVQKTIQALEPTLALAAASGKDMAFSAELTAGSLASFGYQADQASRVVNTLYASTTETRLDLDRISMALKNAAPTAATFGLEIEETVAHLGTLVQVLGDGSTAGTAMRAILLKLNEATAENKGVVGNALQGWNVHAEGLTGALKRLEQAGVTADEAILQLGMEAGLGLAVLMRAGSKSIEDLEKKITGTNAAFDAMKTMIDNVKGMSLQLFSALQEIALKIFDTYKVQLKGALEDAAKVVQDNGDKIQAIARDIVQAFTDVIHVIGQVAHFISEHRERVEQLVVVLGGAVAAIYLVATAMSVLNAVMAMNPVLLIVAAVGAAIAGFILWINHLGGFHKVWIDITYGVKVGVTSILTWLARLWNDLKLGYAIVMEMPNQWKIALGLVWDAIKIFASLALDTFKNLGRAILEPWKAGEILGEIKDRFAVGLEDLLDAAEESGLGQAWVDLVTSHDEANEEILARWRETLAQMKAERDAAVAGLEDQKAGGGAGTGESEIAQTLQTEEAKHAIRIRYGEEYKQWLTDFGDFQQVVEDRGVDEVRRAEELKARARSVAAEFGQMAYYKIRDAAAKVTSFEELSQIKLGKLMVSMATEVVAAKIEAKAQEAAFDAVASGALALFLMATGNFAGAAKAGAAAAMYGSLAAGAAVTASVVRNLGSGGSSAIDSYAAEASASEVGTSSGGSRSGRQSYDVSSRQAPETVNVYLSTTVMGSVIGDSGMDELVEQYLLPRLRPLYEGGVLG